MSVAGNIAYVRFAVVRPMSFATLRKSVSDTANRDRGPQSDDNWQSSAAARIGVPPEATRREVPAARISRANKTGAKPVRGVFRYSHTVGSSFVTAR